MKKTMVIVEFGVVGGRYSQHECSSIIEGWKLAENLAWMLGRNGIGWMHDDFKVSSERPVVTWQSSTHFVCVRLFTPADQAKEDAYQAEAASWAMRP